MTESEWFNSDDPSLMLGFLGRRLIDRKRWLACCGCCRRTWHLLVDQRTREAVEVMEQVADGLAERRAINALAAGVAAAVEHTSWKANASDASHLATTAVRWALSSDVASVAVNVSNALARASDPQCGATYSATKKAELFGCCGVLRDVVGNPFRPPAVISDDHRTPPVLRIAQTIYDERAFAELPVLADALEEAGCANEATLDHLRSAGPHVRGCWVVDALLGKS